MSETRPRLGVVGAGKVGVTLARLLYTAGYTIASVHSRTPAHAAALAAQVNARTETPTGVMQSADLVLLTTADDALADLAAELAAAGESAAVVHTSGVRDADVLAVLERTGSPVGSLHPAYPFADVDSAVAGLPAAGAVFAVEAEDARLRGWLLEIVAALHGRPLIIPRGGKAAYHAALTLLSNYTVTLYAAAEQLVRGLGADAPTARAALDVLLAGTVANLRALGTPDALTGPLVRGDVGTLAAHVAAIDDADTRAAYLALARLTVPLARARGLSDAALERLTHFLAAQTQDNDHAADRP